MELVERTLWQQEFTTATAIEIRQMKARVEKRRVPLGEDPDFHLKLGPGGLVDVEFLVQLMQLEYGFRIPDVRITSTLGALEALEENELISSADAAILAEAYRFCTHVRNRLYLQAGRRTDALPRDPADEWKLAVSLGYERRSDLREEYRRVTRRARRVFEDLFYPGGRPGR